MKGLMIGHRLLTKAIWKLRHATLMINIIQKKGTIQFQRFIIPHDGEGACDLIKYVI